MVGAKLDRSRMRAPNFKNARGMGIRTTATQASKVPAQLTLSALNMYVAKRGKTAPAMERRNVFAAMAEAALWAKKKYNGQHDKFNVLKILIHHLQHEVGINDVIQRLEENG